MDSLKIGPSGETFGQLKQNVKTARRAYMDKRTEATLKAYQSAQDMLRAAYVRVGLPYVAP